MIRLLAHLPAALPAAARPGRSCSSLVQAIANLYLPDLNADIINNGVAKGDTDYILQTGALMLVVTLVLGVASIIAVYWGAKIAMGFGRDVRGAIFRKVETLLPGRGQPLRHAVADHPQHERRPAGPDGRASWA